MLLKLPAIFLVSLFVYLGIDAADEDKQSDAAKTDPNIYNVQRITPPSSDAISTMPIFDSTGRLVYFQGQGKEYGTTKCSHIYQLDLATRDISLFSTGLGHERRVVLKLQSTAGKGGYSPDVISTASYAFNQLANGLKTTAFTNDDLCPPSPCSVKNPVPECGEPHFEQYNDEGAYTFNKYGKVQSIAMHETAQDKPTGSSNVTCLTPYIYAAGQKNLAMCAQSNDNGEQVAYRTTGGSPTPLTNFESGAFDGFYSLFGDTTDKKGNLFFHGYQFSKPPTEAEKPKVAAIKAGVIPRKGSVIFQGSADDILATHPVEPTKVNGLVDGKDYVFPVSAPNGIVVFTQYDQTKSVGTLYSLNTSSATLTQLTNSDYSTEFGSLDPTNKYIVFQSNRMSTVNQLFFGAYPDKNVLAPIYKPASPKAISASFSSYILSSLNYLSDDLSLVASTFRSPRISKSGMLMYTGGDLNDQANYCPQIYQIDPKWNDTTVRRKVSSGIHAYDSPNFLSGDDILYAATLTKDYTKGTASGNGLFYDLCNIRVCVNGNPDYDKVLCDSSSLEKPIHPDSELYISNKYGSIKQRLTKNKVYDGDATVYNSDLVVYSAYSDTTKDIELFSLKLSDKDPEASRKRLTNTYGYEGAVSFSSDGKIIAYEGYQPSTTDEISAYKTRLAANYVNLDATQIYFYHFESKKAYHLILYPYGPYYSPTFLDSERVVFLASGTKNRFNPSLMLVAIHCSSTGCTVEPTTTLEQYQDSVYNIFFQPDLKAVAFTHKDGVYVSTNVQIGEIITKEASTIRPEQTTTTTTTTTLPPPINKGTTDATRNTTDGSMHTYEIGVLTTFLASLAVLAF